MAVTVHTLDPLVVDPPLNARERRYLRGITRQRSRLDPTPGPRSPWVPSEDGRSLYVPVAGTSEPVAEWAVFLIDALLGPGGPDRHGTDLSGFTHDHRVRGRVRVEGPSRWDCWTLLADDDEVQVQRTHMPCAACWVDALLESRPTAAYRFLHPVREANLVDGTVPDFDHVAMARACREAPCRPVGATIRPVAFPVPVDLTQEWWVDLALTPDARPLRERDPLAPPPPLGRVLIYPPPMVRTTFPARRGGGRLGRTA